MADQIVADIIGPINLIKTDFDTIVESGLHTKFNLKISLRWSLNSLLYSILVISLDYMSTKMKKKKNFLNDMDLQLKRLEVRFGN